MAEKNGQTGWRWLRNNNNLNNQLLQLRLRTPLNAQQDFFKHELRKIHEKPLRTWRWHDARWLLAVKILSIVAVGYRSDFELKSGTGKLKIV